MNILHTASTYLLQNKCWPPKKGESSSRAGGAGCLCKSTTPCNKPSVWQIPSLKVYELNGII